jgi:putative hydrolase of the HAD superfamily
MALVSDFNGYIFDYGGVLVHHQTEADQQRMANIAKMPAERFTEFYWSERSDYDKGLMSVDEYWGKISQLGRAQFTPQIIDQLTELDTISWMNFDLVMWDWIDQLRAAGKRVAMLSNMPRELGEALKSRTDRLNGFDHVTLSYEVRSVKPEPAIYDECLDGLGTPAAETLFLDDRIANVQAAEMLGIRGMHFTSRDEVLERLRP